MLGKVKCPGCKAELETVTRLTEEELVWSSELNCYVIPEEAPTVDLECPICFEQLEDILEEREEGLFPSEPSYQDEDDIEEEK